VSSAIVLLVLLLVLVGMAVPAYVVGKRREVRDAWVAFIPLFGPTIVLLWSMDRSGWMCLIALIPIVGFFWSIWFAVELPAHHGRTRWWAAAFFFLPLIGYYLYAFTLDDMSERGGQGLVAGY
jgi:formate hydrogenlyase subunit 3/multisubunit Na+/H+ antiporter MnhD subunit